MKGWKIFGVLVILVVMAGFAYWYFTKDKKSVTDATKGKDPVKTPPAPLDPLHATKEHTIKNFKPGDVLYRDGEVAFGEKAYWSGQMGSLQKTDDKKEVILGKYVKTEALSMGNTTNYLVAYQDLTDKNYKVLYYKQDVTNVYVLR